MSPTYSRKKRFDQDYDKLSRQQQDQFLTAIALMVADLKAGGPFSRRLRIKGVQGHPGVFEMSWAPDGRATWEYGPEQRAGEPHIIWRRVGTHAIFNRP